MLSETQSNFADDVKNRRHEISTKKTREEKKSITYDLNER